MTPSKLSEWISALSTPSAAFGGLAACPFAQGAKIVRLKITSKDGLFALLSSLEDIPPGVVLVVEIPPRLSLPSWGWLRDKPWVGLESDPERPITVAGRRTTQSIAKLILIQNRDELKRARTALAARGYFDLWDEGSIARIGRL